MHPRSGTRRANAAEFVVSLIVLCKGENGCLLPGFLALATVASAAIIPNLFPFLDPTGLISTYNANGPIDESRQECFLPEPGHEWALLRHLPPRERWIWSGRHQRSGEVRRDAWERPAIRVVDGANCPNSASHDASSHSLLLKSGLIRDSLPVPANAQFQIQAYRDPYGCAVVTDESTGVQTVSVYRRPLPTTNLRFLSAVMFDGRETHQPLTAAATFQRESSGGSAAAGH